MPSAVAALVGATVSRTLGDKRKRIAMIARLTAIGILLTCSLQVHADTVTRREGETPVEFVLRVSPSAQEVIHPVVATKEWTPGKVALIAFVSHEYSPPDNKP